MMNSNEICCKKQQEKSLRDEILLRNVKYPLKADDNERIRSIWNGFFLFELTLSFAKGKYFIRVAYFIRLCRISSIRKNGFHCVLSLKITRFFSCLYF